MFKKVHRYLKSPYYAFGDDLMKTHPRWMSDKYFIKVFWKRMMSYPLDLKHPKTFNEKLQWMKLYDRNPLYTNLVDKLKVKAWVADKIGSEHVIPTLAVYNSVDDIRLEELPDQFVLKCNHDSGGVVLCRDKSEFDLDAAKEKLKKSLDRNFYWDYREWAYKDVERKIFAEKYMVDSTMRSEFNNSNDGLNDNPRIIEVDFDLFKWHKRRAYNTAWNVIEKHILSVDALPNVIDNQRVLREIRSLVTKYSEMVPIGNIDYYLINNRIYFVEVTFHDDNNSDFTLEVIGLEKGNCVTMPTNKRFSKGWLVGHDEYLVYFHSEPKRPKFVGLKDYKFFCFNGEPKIMYVANDRSEFPTMDFFDMDYCRLPLYTVDPPAFFPPSKPNGFEEMKGFAALLSQNIPQVRVDFYENEEGVFFGEMTFYHSTGFSEIHPMEWNQKMGEWIKLPKKRC